MFVVVNITGKITATISARRSQSKKFFDPSMEKDSELASHNTAK